MHTILNKNIKLNKTDLFSWIFQGNFNFLVRLFSNSGIRCDY